MPPNNTLMREVEIDLERRLSQQGNFKLDNLEGFPYVDYMENLEKYLTSLRWWNGKALEEKDNNGVELYPVGVNPLPNTFTKHVAGLFGQFDPSKPTLITPKMIANDKAERPAAIKLDRILGRWHWENNSAAIQLENGFMSQIFGTCVFKISYDDTEPWRQVPVRQDRILPMEFVGVFNPSDPWRLVEGWMVRIISPSLAAQWLGKAEVNEANEYYWIEQWGREKYTIRINSTTLQVVRQGKAFPLNRKNPFGFVPMVAIPHTRVGETYGTNAHDHLHNIILEMNRRIADYGDATSQDSHPIPFMRNVQGNPSFVTISDPERKEGFRVLDLSQRLGFDEKGADPHIDLIQARNLTSSSLKDNYRELERIYRQQAFHPPVADGEDEGSQRSGETLYARWWHLLAHTDQERILWACGLNVLTSMAVQMLHIKKKNGVTRSQLAMRIMQEFAPPLARNRKELMDELAIRATHKLGSVRHLMSLTKDIEDPDEQLAMIDEENRILAASQMIPEPQNPDGEDPEEEEEEEETEKEVPDDRKS